jgi:hypothetical protein
MKHNLCLLLLAGAVVSAVPLLAHHSFAATYFDDQTQIIEGSLVQYVFRNPHSFVHVEVPDETGQEVRWAVEWGSGQQLSGQGVAADTLKFGDHVIVTGNPGRNPEDHRMRMRSIVRPKDGWKWTGTFQ